MQVANQVTFFPCQFFFLITQLMRAIYFQIHSDRQDALHNNKRPAEGSPGQDNSQPRKRKAFIDLTNANVSLPAMQIILGFSKFDSFKISLLMFLTGTYICYSNELLF